MIISVPCFECDESVDFDVSRSEMMDTLTNYKQCIEAERWGGCDCPQADYEKMAKVAIDTFIDKNDLG